MHRFLPLREYLFQIKDCVLSFSSWAVIKPCLAAQFLHQSRNSSRIDTRLKCYNLPINVLRKEGGFLGKNVATICFSILMCLQLMCSCVDVGCVCVCERAKESEWERERENSKQWTVQSDEADGNHSLDKQGRDEEGEEETGLAVKSATHKNNILSHFQRRHGTDFCNAKKIRQSHYHGCASWWTNSTRLEY